VVTWFLFRQFQLLLESYPPELAMHFIIIPLLSLILFWSVVSDFSAILHETQSKFYLSAELEFLIQTPMPAATLFIFQFIKATVFPLLLWSFFVLSPLITWYCRRSFVVLLSVHLLVTYLLMTISASECSSVNVLH